MKITKRGVELDEGEEFVEEVQDENNVMRIATFTLADGNHVLIERHFSQIGPCVYGPDGKPIRTEYNRETNSVRKVEGV